jgi:hypothetical protein
MPRIAKLSGWSNHRYVDEYYRRTGQLQTWRDSHPGFLNYFASCIQALEDSIKPSYAIIIQLAQQNAYARASPAQQYTFQYFQLCPTSEYQWETLETALERYFDAKQNFKKSTLRSLTEGLDMSVMGLSRVLKELNLHPLRIRRVMSGRREATKRAFYLDMSLQDVSYFLPRTMPDYIPKVWAEMGPRPDVDTSFLGIVKNFRTASKMYLKIDSGETENDSANRKVKNIMKKAREMRYFVEPMIVQALRVIYSNPGINKPYLENTFDF